MMPQAIQMAEQAIRKYKTRDPFQIIEQRKIKLRWFDTMPHLLGYFTVMNKGQYIGINALATESEQLMAAGHELGHSFLDYKTAASGARFEDTHFYSVNNSRCECNANLFDAELLISDESILEPLYYDDYCETKRYIEERIGRFKTQHDRLYFEQDQLRDFFSFHEDIPSMPQLAADLGFDQHLIEFKFLALQHKGFDLPNILETKNDFLKRI